jgi:uncharacterized membrane protein
VAFIRVSAPMVTLQESAEESLLIAQPNRSASWRLNKLIIALFAIWWTVIAGVFVYLGLWPIVPFAGIEIAGLAFALYYVCWKLQQRHVLRFRAQQLILQKGAYYPRFTWQFPRDTVSLSVEVQPHPWDPLKIFLCDHNEQIPLGNFLNKDDSKTLLALLRAQGLRVRNHSGPMRLDI